MKRNLVLLIGLIGLMLIFGIGIISAQDTPVTTVEPTATLAVIAPVATVAQDETLAVISPDGSTTPVKLTFLASITSALNNSSNERAFWVFVVIILILVIVAMAFHYNAQVRDMVSPQTARAIYNDTAAFLTGLTRRIPGEGDDLMKNIALGVVDDQLKKWEAARSSSQTTIHVNPTPTLDAQPAAPQQFTDALQVSPG